MTRVDTVMYVCTCSMGVGVCIPIYYNIILLSNLKSRGEGFSGELSAKFAQ